MKNNFDLKGYMKENKVGAYQQLNEMWYSDMQAIGQPLGMRHTAPINEEEETIEEMGGVKSVGDAGKMATPNSRPNLGRHRSSDMLDKISKKDHNKNTVVGAKAAAYKAPHMKEEEEMFGAEPEGSNLQSYIEDLGDNASAEDLLNYYQENGLAIGEMQELMNHYGISVEQLALVFKDLKMNMLNNMNKTGRNKKMYEDEDPFGAIKTGIDKITQGGQEETGGDYDRIMDLGGEKIEQGIISLMDDGFDAKDIMDLCKMLINARRGGRHSQY